MHDLLGDFMHTPCRVGHPPLVLPEDEPLLAEVVEPQVGVGLNEPPGVPEVGPVQALGTGVAGAVGSALARGGHGAFAVGLPTTEVALIPFLAESDPSSGRGGLPAQDCRGSKTREWRKELVPTLLIRSPDSARNRDVRE